MKKLLRSAVLTIITAGMLSIVATPKTIKPVSPSASPMPCSIFACEQ